MNSERLPAQEQPPSPQDLPLAREPQSTPGRVADDHDKEYDSDDDRDDDKDGQDNDDDRDDDQDDQDDHLCGGIKLRLPLSLARLDTRLKPRFRFRKSSYKIR